MLRGIVCSSTDVVRTLPQNSFKTMSYEKDNKLFYGVELEIECERGVFASLAKRVRGQQYMTREEIAAIVEKAMNEYAVLKVEHTVNNGFEIVTTPLTLDMHRCIVWDDMFKKSRGMLNTPRNCGMHIHFSRDATTPQQLAKMIYFMHETTNSGFLSKIAGRKVYAGAEWCKQRKKVIPNTETVTPEEAAQHIIGAEDRQRGAIGVSGRFAGKSVEVRIFAANAKKASIVQGLEFVDALIRYCEGCSLTEKALSYDAFMQWFTTKNMQQQYPTFNDNLLRLGIVEKPLRGVAVLTPKKKAV